jgi:methionyl-tRNA formyltransferase
MPPSASPWQRVDAELDTSPILAQATVPIEDGDMTIEQIGPKLGLAAFGLLPAVLERLAAVADVFDAVTSERSCASAQPAHVGVEAVVSDAGTASIRKSCDRSAGSSRRIRRAAS